VEIDATTPPSRPGRSGLPTLTASSTNPRPARPPPRFPQSLVATNGAIIFVYPKADTPGCTRQGCGFRDNYEDLVEMGFNVFGMSADQPRAQAAWKKDQGFQYPLLCDTDMKVMEAMGAAQGGKAIRSHFVINKGGEVLDVQCPVDADQSVPLAVDFVKKFRASDPLEQFCGTNPDSDECVPNFD